MRGRTAIRGLAGGALVAAAALVALGGWGAAGWWPPPLVALGVGAAETVAVPLAIGRQRWRLALAETLVGAALVVAPGGWLVAAVAVGTAAATQVRHLPRLNAVFEAARASLAVACAVLVARLAGAGLAGGVAGLVTYVAAAHLLSAAAVAATARRPLWSLVRGRRTGLVQSLGNGAAGVLAGELLRVSPLGLVGWVVPLALLWSAYDHQRRRDAELSSYAELVRGQEQTSGRSVDVAAQVVLTAAARLLGGADVELVLRHPAGPIRYVGDEYGTRIRERVGGAAFDAEWVLHALGAGRVVCGVEADRPYLAAALGIGEGGQSAPVAVLGAWRPAGATRFGRSDLLSFDVLVAQAAAWLAVPELNDPDAAGERSLGVPAQPALRSVREAAHRLSRLAQRLEGPDPVRAIVEELHVTERAVAALLGAVAVPEQGALGLAAAENEPASGQPTAGPAAGAVEWTTTGVLQ